VSGTNPEPWYRRTLRWGQTNLTEADPVRYDTEWWRGYWRRTQVQGVIVNAGGIVAYYPSRYPLQRRAVSLGDRDLYGDVVRAARDEGLVVIARMDSNRADEQFYVEHPDWFAVDAAGEPYRAGELYLTCINSPYYSEFIPSVLVEIIERSQPEGFADNSWSGLDRNHICYCRYCVDGFRRTNGLDLPRRVDWDDPTYRAWIRWSYASRLAVWDLNNEWTTKAGGPDCLWIGMNGGRVEDQSVRLRDYKAIGERSPIVFLDSQRRSVAKGFQANADSGKLIHDLVGWDTMVPESTALYNAGEPTFRLGSKPAAEARMWALEGFAAGIQPWWHHIGAYHEDRRQYRTAESLFRWHAANERYLVDRSPVATVGVIWSQDNVDFFGRDDADQQTASPYRGIVNALLRARIPYRVIHADNVDREAAGLSALVLPNVGALSDDQCAQLRRFADGGGGIFATGETSRYDENGTPRDDFGLAGLFGAHATGTHHGSPSVPEATWASWSRHTYLRISPELRADVDGPIIGTEPVVDSDRHPVLDGFGDTDILPFAGRLEVVRTDDGTEAPLTLVPPFPIYPPEKSWMAAPRSAVPGLVLRSVPGGGRIAYLPADLDRCYDRDKQPDHGQLLAGIVRWVAGDDIPITVDGPGRLDCHVFAQGATRIVHLVNLTGAGDGPMDQHVPVGPLRVRVRVADSVVPATARLLVADTAAPAAADGEWVEFVVPSVTDHEVVVLNG
jgi:hypothetical protein